MRKSKKPVNMTGEEFKAECLRRNRLLVQEHVPLTKAPRRKKRKEVER